MPGVALLDRTSDASHNRSVFTIAGEHEAVDDRPRAPGRERRSTRSTWTPTRASTRASARSTSSRSSRSATRRWTTCIDLARAFGERIATRFELPVYLYARAATRPDREKLADVRRGQYEGLKAEIGQRGREPDFGPAAAPPIGRRGRGRRAPVPDRLQHQPRLRRRRPRQAHRAARPRVGRRAAARPGQRVRGPRARTRPPAPRPGVDEPARLHRDAALAGLGRGPRPRRRGRRRARPSPSSSGSRPLAVVPGRRRPRRSAPRTIRSRSGCAAAADVHPAARLLARCRRSSCGSRRRAAAPARRRPATARAVVSGGPFRVIEGGRTGEPTPGLLDRRRGGGRDAGGRRPARRGAGRRRPAAWPTTRPSPDAPVGRGLGGPDRRGRAARGGRGRAGGRGPAARPVRPDRRGRRRGHARASSIRTRTCCSRARARTSSSCASRARRTSTSWPRAAGSSRRSPRPAPPRRATLLAHGRRWLDEMLGHGVTTIEAKSGYGLDLETELRLVEVAYRLGREGPIDVVPTWLGAHAVPPEFRTRPDGTEAYVRSLIDEQLPGIAAHGRARFADVFCETGVFTRRPVAARPRGGPGIRAAAAAPRRRAGAIRRRGAGRRARRRVGRPPGDAVARAGSRAMARRGRGRRAGRRHAAARHDLVPHEGPPRAGAGVHRGRRAGRDRHGLQSRAPHPHRTCRWRCRSPASTSGMSPDEACPR